MFAKLKKKIQVDNGSADVSEKDAAGGSAVDDGLPGVHLRDRVQQTGDTKATVPESDKLALGKTVSQTDVLETKPQKTSDKLDGPTTPSTAETTTTTTLAATTAAEKMVTSVLTTTTTTTDTSHLHRQISDLLSQLCDKNAAIERLESALEKQQEISDKKTKELSDQCNSLRLKMSEAVSAAAQQKEEEMKKEISELKATKTAVQNKKYTMDESTMTDDEAPLPVTTNNVGDHSVLDDKIGMLTEQNKQLQQQIDELVITKQQQTTTVQDKLDSCQQEFQIKEQQLQQQINELNEEISQLKVVGVHSDEEIKQLTEQLEEKCLLVSELTLTNTSLTDHINHLKSLQESHDKVKDMLETRCISYQQEAEKVTNQRRDADTELQRVSAELEMSREQATELDRLTQEYRERYEQTARQVTELEQRLESSCVESDGQVVDQLKQCIIGLEDQVSDKNKVIKKQEQLLSDLKKTLQRELKVQPLPNSASTPNLVAANGVDAATQASRGGLDSKDTASHTPATRGSIDDKEPALRTSFEAAVLPVNDTTDHYVLPHSTDFDRAIFPGGLDNDSSRIRVERNSRRHGAAAHDCLQDVNFRYLRHVVVKFLVSKETEAMQLIRALAVLLHLSAEEQQLIRETLEWRISWFGTKPQISPSVYHPRIFQTP